MLAAEAFLYAAFVYNTVFQRAYFIDDQLTRFVPERLVGLFDSFDQRGPPCWAAVVLAVVAPRPVGRCSSSSTSASGPPGAGALAAGGPPGGGRLFVARPGHPAHVARRRAEPVRALLLPPSASWARGWPWRW